jgi:outer membrane protein assembly factor BamB
MRHAFVAALVLSAATVHAQNWPAFRGPNAEGISATAVPTSWDVGAAKHIAWKLPIPGLAHSSPIVWGDRIYLTTAVPASGERKVVTGDVQKSGIDSATDTGIHTWRLLAIDKHTGRIAWDKSVHQGVPRMKRHVKASHASSTPVTDGRSIVALMGTEGLFCFDMNGTLKWRKDLGVMDVGLVDDPSYQWGPASSPIILGNTVIVQNDRHKDSYLAAFDLGTGRELWRTAHDEYPSWATPAVVKVGSRTEIVTNSGKFIRGFDPQSGKELWRFSDNNTQVKVPTPVPAGDFVIVTGGYPPGGRPIYALKPGASGDVTASGVAWKTDRGAPYTGTPVVHEGILYALTDNGILSAYEAKSGTRIYQQRVSPEAAGFSASPIVAGGRLYLTSEEGDIFVVKAGRTFELLATNRMGEVTMATPVPSGNTLFVRTLTQLVAIR